MTIYSCFGEVLTGPGAVDLRVFSAVAEGCPSVE